MRNLFTLLFLFFIINTSFADNYTYLKGPQISFSNQLVTSSGGTTTFNSLTPMITTVTGTQTQIIKLPSVSSIPVGYSYQIINESTQTLTVKDSLDVVIASIEPDTDKKFILFTGGSWSVSSGGGGQGGSEYVYAGAVTTPSITDNGGGSVTVGAIDVVLFDNATQVGTAKKYSLPALTVTLVDNSTNYIVADYAGGSPALANTTNVGLINESSVVPIYTIYRSGSFLHVQSWDSLGNGLANKLHQSIVKTQRYRRESGLALGETGTRNVTLGSGIVWTGANSLSLASISTGTDNLFYFLRTGASTWITQVVTQYNNTDYWNGTTTASLTNNRYAVNWVYRGVESQKHLYVVLGEGDYTLTQAQASQPPANLPAQITSHALLVGRIIVLKSAATATQIDSSFNVVFSGAGASDHNSLTGLQGGTTGEYYHLTAAEDTAVASLSGTTTNYVLKRSATGFANSQIFDNGTNVGVSGTFSVQSGAAAGTARFGADVNATTITDGVRKLARFTMPSFNTASPDLALFAGDFSSSGTSIITFGGVPSSTSVVAATRLDFMTAATATTTGGTTHMTLNSSGFLGLGTTNPSSKLTIVGGVNGTETVTATASGSLSPNLFTVNINPASNSSAEIRALGFSSTTQGSSSLATVRGGYFEVRNTGSGTITTATGVSSTGMVFPSTAQNFGLISDVVSFISVPINSFSNTVTGTISNARGLRVNNAGLTSNQTLTNLIGVSLDALTAGTNNTYILMGQSVAPTGNFGIYNASANNNYFNGNIGVGATTATTKLYVTGDSTVTGYQYFGDPATNGSFRMYVSGGALKIEKRISGTWTAAGQFDEL